MKKAGKIAAFIATVALGICSAAAINIENSEIPAASAADTAITAESASPVHSEQTAQTTTESTAAQTVGQTTAQTAEQTTMQTAEQTTVQTSAQTAEQTTMQTAAQTTVSLPASAPQTTTQAPPAETTKQTESASSGTVTVSAAVSNSWQEGENNCYQIDATVKNTGNAVSSWTAKLPSAENVKIMQSWNCRLTVSGNEITVVNESYNGELAVGGETTFGFIISTPSAYSIGSAQGSGGNADGAGGTDADTEENKQPVIAESGFVSDHGRLHLDGTLIKDEHGNTVQLKGMSTHGIQWFPSFVNKNAFRTLRDDWNTNTVRIAMYTGESEGYTAGTKANIEALAEQAIKDCIELDMYVIIDWHLLADRTPMTRKADAIEFFERIAKTYGEYPNIIYELCNEPNGGATWEGDVKPYAEEVISVIRRHDKDNLIIVGTPTWSQDIDKALANPIDDDGVLYALHFYSATHGQWLRDRVRQCSEAGLPIFVSEFGMCDSSGGGANNFAETEKWLGLFNELGISYINWSLADKNETCCAIQPGRSGEGGWSDSDLTEGGRWIRNYFREH